MSEARLETVSIVRLGARGDGLTQDGLAIPGALPGERVAVERDGHRARLVTVEAPSPERIVPFCPYFAGGQPASDRDAETLSRSGYRLYETGSHQDSKLQPVLASEAKQSREPRRSTTKAGLLRFARKDGGVQSKSVQAVARSGKGARRADGASSDEAAPRRCGGCAVQHLAPEPYAAWKRGIVAQALAQARIETDLAPLVDAHGAGRRRITLHVREIEGRARAGLMAARSHSLVPIDHCPITVPALHRAPAVAEALSEPLGRGRKPLDVQASATESGLDIDIRGHGPITEAARAALTRLATELDLARLSLHGDGVVERRPPILTSGEARLLPPPGGFLQATQAGEASLTALVCGAMDARTKRVADLFCGSGPFALALARSHEVHAVEGDEAALRALDRAARAAPALRRITNERRDLFRRPLLAPDLDRFDAVVFDPPRAGAQAQARWLAESKVPLVIGVSCDPGTFARDAATLIGGGYRLERVTPVDQFRYSSHVELVGVFRKAPQRPRRR